MGNIKHVPEIIGKKKISEKSFNCRNICYTLITSTNEFFDGLEMLTILQKYWNIPMLQLLNDYFKYVTVRGLNLYKTQGTQR